MAYTTPLTATSNAVLTAAQWNASVRDNFAETAVAKATTAGQYPVATGLNALAMRTPAGASDVSTGTTTSLTYTNTLTGSAGTGPAVTVTSGATALVSIAAVIQNGTGSTETAFSYQISGATTVAAADEWAVRFTPFTASIRGRHGALDWRTGLTPGSNTFTMVYKSTSGAATATFDDRTIVVVPY